jgi:hypothetical protein
MVSTVERSEIRFGKAEKSTLGLFNEGCGTNQSVFLSRHISLHMYEDFVQAQRGK